MLTPDIQAQIKDLQNRADADYFSAEALSIVVSLMGYINSLKSRLNAQETFNDELIKTLSSFSPEYLNNLFSSDESKVIEKVMMGRIKNKYLDSLKWYESIHQEMEKYEAEIEEKDLIIETLQSKIQRIENRNEVLSDERFATMKQIGDLKKELKGAEEKIQVYNQIMNKILLIFEPAILSACKEGVNDDPNKSARDTFYESVQKLQETREEQSKNEWFMVFRESAGANLEGLKKLIVDLLLNNTIYLSHYFADEYLNDKKTPVENQSSTGVQKYIS